MLEEDEEEVVDEEEPLDEEPGAGEEDQGADDAMVSANTIVLP